MKERNIKIQLKTVDGVLIASDHDEKIDISGGPVPNPAPSARVFSKDGIEVIFKRHQHLAKVRVGEREYFMKTMPWKFERPGIKAYNAWLV